MTEVLAFTAEHVCRLTGLSSSQLRYWDKTKFFSPTLVDSPSRIFHRIYAFRDLVGLRAIAVLRKRYRIPLQELRKVGEWLHKHYATPWASLRFALAGRDVVFLDPKTGKPIEARGEGQVVAAFGLEPIADEMREAAERLKDRQANQIGSIVRNRYVVRNSWVVAGTRIPVSAIWNFHEAGFSSRQIIREYPRLTSRDVSAAIKFEARRRRAA